MEPTLLCRYECTPTALCVIAPVIACILRPESKRFNNLVLIVFALARGGSSKAGIAELANRLGSMGCRFASGGRHAICGAGELSHACEVGWRWRRSRCI